MSSAWPMRRFFSGRRFLLSLQTGRAFLRIMVRTSVRQTPFEMDGHQYVVVCAEEEATLQPVALAGLTRSEREVATLVAEGLSSEEIAVRRQRSVRTVENQLAAIFRKLAVGSRAELLALLARTP